MSSTTLRRSPRHRRRPRDVRPERRTAARAAMLNLFAMPAPPTVPSRQRVASGTSRSQRWAAFHVSNARAGSEGRSTLLHARPCRSSGARLAPGGYVVQPRVLCATINIERGIRPGRGRETLSGPFAGGSQPRQRSHHLDLRRSASWKPWLPSMRLCPVGYASSSQAALIGGSVRQTPKPAAWYVTARGPLGRPWEH